MSEFVIFPNIATILNRDGDIQEMAILRSKIHSVCREEDVILHVNVEEESGIEKHEIVFEDPEDARHVIDQLRPSPDRASWDPIELFHT